MPVMDIRAVYVLDLDGSVVRQRRVEEQYRPVVAPAREWGERIRIGTTFRQFRRFTRELPLPEGDPDGARIVLMGSGDFHHVTLALLRRLTQPVNLLVLDRHPDWMRGIGIMHCGSWLLHAAQLPQVARVFHVGGDVDFENGYYWLTPWPLLADGTVELVPAVRRFRYGRWRRVDHTPLRRIPYLPAGAGEIVERIEPWRADLASLPLYISVDKDVLNCDQACTNWGSGWLTLEEVTGVVRACLAAAGGRLAGADTVGDWSQPRTHGAIPTVLDRTRLEETPFTPVEADECNDLANVRILEALIAAARPARGAIRTVARPVPRRRVVVLHGGG